MNEPDRHPELQAAKILEVLERHRVEYVVIGGFAAQLHGAARPTYDIDVTPRGTEQNLDRLAAALSELGARIRTESIEGGLAFNTSGAALAGQRMLNLVTPLGEVDLTFAPAGVDGFEDLARSAAVHRVGGVQVRVAALEDVIRSKTAAGRPKDLQALPELRRLARGQAGSEDNDQDEDASAARSAAAVASLGFPHRPGRPSARDAAQARIAAARDALALNRDVDQQPGPEDTRGSGRG